MQVDEADSADVEVGLPTSPTWIRDLGLRSPRSPFASPDLG